MNATLYGELRDRFEKWFGCRPIAAANAPGRIEVLGNHTDYNEGFVLSAAINYGTCFAASPVPGDTCRLVAGDLMKEVVFSARSPAPSREDSWANYVKGVLAHLGHASPVGGGFNGMFLGDVPLGAGLSSSAALEVSAGLALAALYGMPLSNLALAKIALKAEHEFAGVKCGLLDQITSLFGRPGELVLTDFRTLDVKRVPLGGNVCFLACNTHAKHALVDSAYNERRARCEEAAQFFASALDHPVSALRDVSMDEWRAHSPRMNPVAARRAAHVIGENERVRRGEQLLLAGKLVDFGRLMFESHQSSKVNFENSCPELDHVVESAASMPAVLGARLSGGGFGGSAVVLVDPADAAEVGGRIASCYEKAFGRPCDVLTIRPSEGARLLSPGA